MSTKDFCDECNKEILETEKYYEVRQGNYPFTDTTYCASCFQKHWKEPLTSPTGGLPKKED